MEVPFSPDEQAATNSKKTETTSQKTLTRRIRCIEFKNSHPRRVDRGQLLSIPMNNRPERMDTHALMPYPASAVRLKLLGLAEELTSDEHAAYLASAGAELVKLGVP